MFCTIFLRDTAAKPTTPANMPSSTFVVKNLALMFDAIQSAQSQMQEKLERLKQSQPRYKLFTFEGDRQHPYYGLVDETLAIETSFAQLVAALKTWDVGGITIAEELAKLQGNPAAASQTLGTLHAITPVATTMDECADCLHAVVKSIALFRSHVAPSWVKQDIQEYIGAKKINGHIEVPLLNINPACNAAFTQAKNLCKCLIDVVQDQTTLRERLEIKQSMLASVAVGNAPTSDTVIELILNLR